MVGGRLVGREGGLGEGQVSVQMGCFPGRRKGYTQVQEKRKLPKSSQGVPDPNDTSVCIKYAVRVQ